MRNFTSFLVLFLCFSIHYTATSQVFQDDFEGNGTITNWFGDDCGMNLNLANPFPQGENTSATVLEYNDNGGQYANVRQNDNFNNLDPNSLPPLQRTDFNRVVIQVNGENNNDFVVAYLDDIQHFNTLTEVPVFDNLVWSDEFDEDGAINDLNWHHQTLLPPLWES